MTPQTVSTYRVLGRLLAVGLFCVTIQIAHGRVVYNSAQLIDAINDMNSGEIDHILLYPYATYEGTFPTITRNDSATKLIKSNHLTAKAVIQNSTIECSDAKYVYIEDLSFARTSAGEKNGLVQVNSGSRYVWIRDCDFRDDGYVNEFDIDTVRHFIAIHDCGDVIVHDCKFGPKRSIGDMIWISHTQTSRDHHQIYDCEFRDFIGTFANGSGFMTVGGGSIPDKDTGHIVRDNSFHDMDVASEVEAISNKSSNNTYTDNLFYDLTNAYLYLRTGDECYVARNHFFDCKGGVWVQGYDHEIVNNYFDNITGWKAGIKFGGGGGTGNGFVASSGCMVACNTFVNCRWSIWFYANNTVGYEMPTYNLFENNLLYYDNNSPGGTVAFIKIEGFDPLTQNDDWITNDWWANLFDSSQRTGGAPLLDPDDWTTISPAFNLTEYPADMTAAYFADDNLVFLTLGPGSQSAALNAGSVGFSQVTDDIRGNARGSQPDIGCLED